MDSINVKRVDRRGATSQRPQNRQQASSQNPIVRRSASIQQSPLTATEARFVPPPIDRPFDHLRYQLYGALPVPPQAAPLCASIDQVKSYESFFENHNVDKLTIAEVLEPYNGVVAKPKDQCAKILFMSRFITKLTKNGIDHDLAIVCRNIQLEEYIEQSLKPLNLNTKCLSKYVRSGRLYGLMVKIRKNDSPVTRRPIERTDVDTMFVFDAACDFDHYNHQTLLRGIHSDKPYVVYLLPMDSAEIRIHTYNRFIHDKAKEIHWNTKIGTMDRTLQDIVLLQHNRQANQVFFVGWNDYLSQAMFNWATHLKQIGPYEHRFQTKGGLLQQVLEFPTHHPTTKPGQAELKRPPAAVASVSVSKKSRVPKMLEQITKSVKVEVAANQAVNVLQSATQVNSKKPIRSPSLQQTPAFADSNSSASVVRDYRTVGDASGSSGGSVAGPSRSLTTTNTVKPTAPPAAASGGIHPDRLALLMQINNSTEDNTVNGVIKFEVDDLTRKDWHGATGSNASAMKTSLKRPSIDNGEDRAQNKRFKETDTASSGPIQTNLDQAFTKLNDQPPVTASMTSDDGTPVVQQSSITVTSASQGSHSALTDNQHSPAAVEQQGENGDETQSNNTLSTASCTPTAAMTPTELLAKEYSDFLQNAFKQLEADLLNFS